MDFKNKDLVIYPTVGQSQLRDFLSKLDQTTLLYLDPALVKGKGFKVLHESDQADFVLCKSVDKLKELKSRGKTAGYFKKVLDSTDIEDIAFASKEGADFVVVDADDWKIIPLENIIAKLHKVKTRIYATAKNSKEVRTLFSVLELGVDGVILHTDSEKEVYESKQYLNTFFFPIRPARIIEVNDVGIGERVCVDTASMLGTGEGMLIGSKSNFMILIHNESVGSSFTSPRPFRVNAGAVYCYTLMPDGNTKYLSEIESGNEVLIVNKDGFARLATVGRSKIETRPLRLIKADIEGEIGTVILQNAETIRFVKKDGSLLSVTDAKKGDIILGYAKPASGRHFGMEVNEYIVEK